MSAMYAPFPRLHILYSWTLCREEREGKKGERKGLGTLNPKWDFSIKPFPSVLREPCGRASFCHLLSNLTNQQKRLLAATGDVFILKAFLTLNGGETCQHNMAVQWALAADCLACLPALTLPSYIIFAWNETDSVFSCFTRWTHSVL